ncbi:MAG: ribosomal protein S18-alanine N-acetyltransferase [Clostridia bacterium]|nr:ribosomal protein S18-alanine N-acetyltransferase [Clostridia bacterium]
MEYRTELLPREELTAVSRLEKEIFTDAWSYEALLSSYDNPCSVFYRAYDEDNNTVGYVVLYCMYDEAEILNVAVAPTARRHGIASQLITAAVEEGEKRGASAFFLEVRASNEPAIALYKKFGFSPIGVRKKYYSDPTEDAIEMRRG